MYMATRTRSDARKPRTFRWTRAWLARLPNDGNRYEVLDGALLVTPQAGIRHQEIAARLFVALRVYCDANDIGVALAPGAVVVNRSELQPDLQVIPVHGHFADDARWEDQPLPILVVEVLSPGSHRHDLHGKRDAYLSLGIPEYWIVDIERKQVLVLRPGDDEPRIVTDTLSWAPSTAVPPLTIQIQRLLGT